MPHVRNRSIVALACGAVVATLGITRPASAAAPSPFYMGADVSLETFMQQQGVTFKSNGVARPLDQILYDAGDNLFRLRLFVNPQTTYTNANGGAIQALNYDLALAQQLKADAPGAKLLLDLHYSDTWADPGHQAQPAAWAGQSLSQLESTVRSYTSTTLTAFKNAGVMPDMVQVGNEVGSGMLWDTGKLAFSPASTATQQASWQSFGGLVRSAIAGVRDAQGTGPKIDVAVHPGPSDGASFFFSHLADPAYGNVDPSSFDVMGVSYYPANAPAQLSTLKTNLTSLINAYNKKVMVLETNAPWESTNAPASDPAYPDTAAGQLQFLTDLRDTVMTLPNGAGEGVLYWYPEAVQVPGYTIYNGGSTALFDQNGNALPALAAFSAPDPATGGIVSLALLIGASLTRRR